MTDTNTPVTRDAEGNPTLAPSPKVAAGAITGLALTVAVAMLTAVNPDLLDFAGDWKGVLYAGVAALAVSLAAYIKKPAE